MLYIYQSLGTILHQKSENVSRLINFKNIPLSSQALYYDSFGNIINYYSCYCRKKNSRQMSLLPSDIHLFDRN